MNANLTLQGASAVLALSGASSTLTLANTTASTSSSTGALQVAGGAYFGAGTVLNATTRFNGLGSTTLSSGTIFINPATTALTGASAYFFTYLAAPVTTASAFSGTASTLFIAGAPTVTTGGTGFALNVAAGTVRIAGTLQIPTGAINGYILNTDASGNASWVSPTSLGFNGFDDGTVSLPGAYWTNQTSTGFYRPGSGQIFVSLAGTNTAAFTTTSTSTNVNLTLTGTGSTTASSASAFVNPATTALTGASAYFFTHLAAPTTTASAFSGTASTLFIAGAPTVTTGGTGFALNIAGGNTLTAGNVTMNGTSAVLALSGASSTLTLANTTASTSSTTGALRVAGGAYFGANSLMNANLTLQGASAVLALSGASSALTLANTAASTSSVTGALRVAGGAYFGANSLMNANLTLQGASAILALSGASSIVTLANTTASTSSTTGALQNLGGTFTKNIFIGGVSFSNIAGTLIGPLLNVASTTITATSNADTAFVSIQQPTLAATGVQTTANASTVYIAAAPAAGTNETITNAWSLNVAAGRSRFGGGIQIPTGASNGFVLQSDASGNASWASTSGSTTLGYFNAISNATFSTNATVLANITTMTLTPNIAGTYHIIFTATFRGQLSNTTSTFVLALNGTSISNTTSAFVQNAQQNTYTVSINAVQAFNGTSDVVTARVRSSSAASTITLTYRSIFALRLSA